MGGLEGGVFLLLGVAGWLLMNHECWLALSIYVVNAYDFHDAKLALNYGKDRLVLLIGM